jgi:hypothetical protein
VSIYTDGCKSVDWSSLLASNDYKADTYRGISDLEIEYSDSGEKIEEDTVIDEYLDAAVHISAMKTGEIKTVGFRVLKDFMSAPEKMLVFIRLKSRDQSKQFAADLREIFSTLDAEKRIYDIEIFQRAIS